jgi:GT2 family glycosyltransferase
MSGFSSVRASILEPVMSDEPLVSAIIVSYNVRTLLLDAVRSLFEHTGAPVEAIVVDNGSQDGSADAVSEEFSQAKVIRLAENVGFSKANNIGFHHAAGKFILLLNPDVLLDAECVGRMADLLLIHPEVGAVGPRLRRPDGGLDLAARRSFPTPRVALYRLSGLSRLFPHSKRFNQYNLGAERDDVPHEIDAGTAACLLVRRAAIDQVGFFDPDFFMYGEDLDLCFRIKQGGWKIHYLPSAGALHLKGQSTRQVTGPMLFAFHSAMWTFHHKHYASDLPAFANGLVWASIWGRWATLNLRSALANDPRVSR